MSVEAYSEVLQSIFKTPLHIPIYQRPYVWNDAAAEKLLDDIRESFETRVPGRDEGYFIGNIMLIKSDDARDDACDLADGQQRLTTLFILLGQLQDRVVSQKAYADYHCYARFALDTVLTHHVSAGYIRTAIQSPHAEVQKLLEQLARGVVLGEPAKTAAKVKPIGARLVRSYTHVSTVIEKWLQAAVKDRLNLGQFLRYVLEEVEMVVIKYPNTSAALDFFESLNSTGAKLIQADLLKSAFMKKVPPSKWNAVDEHWSEILHVVGSKKDGEDSFLRTASMAVLFPAFKSANEAPRKNELLSRILAHCADYAVDVDVLMAKMSLFARNREALLSESPTYPGGESDQVVARLRRLPKLPDFAVTMLAVIPASLSSEGKWRVALTIEALICVIAISRESKNINYAVQPFCVELRDLKDCAVGSFCSRITDALIKPNITAFHHQFKSMDTSGKHKAWVKYFLWIIEDYLRGKMGRTLLDYSDKARGARKAHLEHIIPQSSTSVDITILHQIGNMTLLEPAKNTSIGADDYLSKRRQYADSEFRVSAELSSPTHGVASSDRVFLDSKFVKPIWAYPSFDSHAVSLRTKAIYELLLDIWGIFDAPPATVCELTPVPADVSREPDVTLTAPSSAPTPSQGPPLSEKEVDIGCMVTVLYGDKERVFKIVDRDYAPRLGEPPMLNVQKERDAYELLGLKVGDSLEGRFLTLSPAVIEILKIE